MKKESIISQIKPLLVSERLATLRVTKRLMGCFDACTKAESLTAIYTHLYRLVEESYIPNAVKAAVEPILVSMLPAVKQESEARDEFGNPVLNALFESELSYAILKVASTESLIKINGDLITYLKKHKEALLASKGSELTHSLERYKLPYDKSVDIIDALILLLQRDPGSVEELTRVQILSETFTLHLMLFNYNHFYDPARDNHKRDAQGDVHDQRARVHRRVRPKDIGGMFLDNIRGRITVFSKKRTTDFGIADERHTPDSLRRIHAYEFTPHKYRARANETSPLVAHMRQEGVSFISGPSGTAADCLEGITFLSPYLSTTEIQSYLNLMAAAETGQGHHSITEVVLTSVNAGVLPMVIANDVSKPIWERINYADSYQQFLTKEFLTSKECRFLEAKHPQFFSESPLVTEAKKERRQEQNAAVVLQQAFRARRASKHFHKARFWENVDETNPDMEISAESSSFVKDRSRLNLELLKNELPHLSNAEKQFLRLFMAQPIELAHFTNQDVEINQSQTLLSYKLLQEKHAGKGFQNNSVADVGKLNNGHYVFFRFSLRHVKSMGSRFGNTHYIFKGHANKLLSNGWVSLAEMLEPTSSSVLHRLTYKGDLIREGSGKQYDETGVVDMHYRATNRKASLNMADTIFYGNDIMPGLALAMIREVRRIGGVFEQDFIKQYSLPRVDISSNAYETQIEHMNWLLSTLFRPEAKLPGAVFLKDKHIETFNPVHVLLAIRDGDIFSLRVLLDSHSMNQTFLLVQGRQCSPLEVACLEGNKEVVEFLLHRGARISQSFYDFILHDSPLFFKQLTPGFLTYLFDNVDSFTSELTTRNRGSLLHAAARHDRLDLMEMMIEIGVDPRVENADGLIFTACINLSRILKKDGLKKLQTLISTCPEISPHQRNEHGESLLHAACLIMNYEAIFWSLNHGLLASLEDDKGNTPLFYLIQRMAVSRLLSTKVTDIQALVRLIPGLDKDIDFLDRVMRIAMKSRRLDMAVYLLSLGATMPSNDAIISLLMSILEQSEGNEFMDAWEVFNEAIDINTVDKKRKTTLLMVAAEHGRMPAMKTLLSSPTLQEGLAAEHSQEMNNALMLYCFKLLSHDFDQFPEVLGILETYPGISLTTKIKATSMWGDDRSILDLLLPHTHRWVTPESLDRLFAVTGQINTLDNQGYTLFHYVIMDANIQRCIHLLHKDMVDISINTSSGMSSGDLCMEWINKCAAENRHDDVTQLFEHFASPLLTDSTVLPKELAIHFMRTKQSDKLLALFKLSPDWLKQYDEVKEDTSRTGYEFYPDEGLMKNATLVLQEIELTKIVTELTRRVMKKRIKAEDFERALGAIAPQQVQDRMREIYDDALGRRLQLKEYLKHDPSYIALVKDTLHGDLESIEAKALFQLFDVNQATQAAIKELVIPKTLNKTMMLSSPRAEHAFWSKDHGVVDIALLRLLQDDVGEAAGHQVDSSLV